MSRLLKYANEGVIKNNPVMALFYSVAYYLSIAAKRAGLTPNAVTALSFLFALIAAVSLVKYNIFVFFVFFLISFLLDFVDGTLARMNDSVGKTALNWDHISDIIKIAIIFLSFGVYFDDALIWTLSFTSSSLYIFYTVLNHEASWVGKFYKLKGDDQNGAYGGVRSGESDTTKNKLYVYIKKRPAVKSIALILFTMLFTVNAHTLLIFFLIPLHEFLAYALLSYFIFIVAYQSWLRLKKLNRMSRVKF